jgi:hypothetical protein
MSGFIGLFVKRVAGLSACAVLFSLCCHAQVPVKVKSHCYLVLKDTVVYCSCDTVIEIPEGEEYKIKKDVSAYFVKILHGRVLQLFYKPPKPEPIVKPDTVVSTKSEVPFLVYENKIIRSITIVPMDVTVTKLPGFMNSHKSAIDSAAEDIHVRTKRRVIQNNLLFSAGDSLNPYLLADNERNLRNLPFLQDARIYIDTCTSTSDSVDVIVVTKDVWTIGLATSANFGSWYRMRVFDANFLGYGQRLELNLTNYETRNPRTGAGVFYSKSNVLGTFIDINTGINNINGGPHLGTETEESVYFSASRSLYLPTTRFTGGISVSVNHSINVFQRSNLEFLEYKYGMFDAWGAFSVSPQRTEKRRLRKGEGAYVSGRVFKQQFFDKPIQDYAQFNPGYNNRWFMLLGLNFFRDRFYKTRYISGFGKTEDVPYGYRFSVLGGYQYTLFRHRYYAGTEFERQFANQNGSFGLFNIGAGTFLCAGRAEDIIINARSYWYSRLLYPGRYKMRQRFYISYAIALAPELTGPTIIPNSESGIRGLALGDNTGHQRLIAHSETTFWLPYIILGFRFANFISVQVGQVGPYDELIFKQTMYAGFGTGFRIKNENLVFKTLEVRAYYYPVVPPYGSKWLVDMSTVVTLNFSSPQIRVPGFIGF